MIIGDRTFNRAKRGKCRLEEKDALGKLCEEYTLDLPPPCQIRPPRLLVFKKYSHPLSYLDPLSY